MAQDVLNSCPGYSDPLSPCKRALCTCIENTAVAVEHSQRDIAGICRRPLYLLFTDVSARILMCALFIQGIFAVCRCRRKGISPAAEEISLMSDNVIL